MNAELLEQFDKCRKNLITSLEKFVKKSANSEVFLRSDDGFVIVRDETIVTEYFRRLFLKDNVLYVEYEEGEGFKPDNFEYYEEEIELFSLNEIYEIIQCIS